MFSFSITYWEHYFNLVIVATDFELDSHSNPEAKMI